MDVTNSQTVLQFFWKVLLHLCQANKVKQICSYSTISAFTCSTTDKRWNWKVVHLHYISWSRTFEWIIFSLLGGMSSFFPFTYQFPKRWLRRLIPAGPGWHYLQTFLWKNMFTGMFLEEAVLFFSTELQRHPVLFKDRDLGWYLLYYYLSNPKHLAGKLETLTMGPITKDHVSSDDVTEL